MEGDDGRWRVARERERERRESAFRVSGCLCVCV
jgi:hypothetical protein